MPRILEDLLRFKFGNGFVLAAQIISILLLLYFLLYKSLKDLKEAQAFPALAVIYMLFSAAFILIFIGYFGYTTKSYLAGFEEHYRNYHNTHDRYVDEDRVAEIRFYQTLISIALPFVLSAFVANFSKAFSTLNSLEVGLLNDTKLSVLSLGKTTKLSEGFLRFVIAVAFIAIEKQLSDWNHGGNFSFVGLFQSLAGVIAGLYLFLLCWYAILAKKVWFVPAFRWWRFLTPVQFAAGVALSLFLLFFSRVSDENVKVWANWLSLWFLLMLALAAIIIGIVTSAEVLGRKESKINGIVAAE
jgi:hypothetical protein